MRPIDSILDPLLAVACARLDEKGCLVDANAGFLRMLDGDAEPSDDRFLAAAFKQPGFASLSKMQPDAEGLIYEGLVTIGGSSNQSWTLNGRIWRHENTYDFLGEHDVEQMEMLNERMLDLNKDYSKAQLDLVQANLKVQRLNEELVEHREHLEELVFSRTAQLAAARDAAEASNRAKQAFLSNMSHELRTPINGIIGMTTLALGQADDAKQAEWLKMGLDSANNLLGIVTNVLEYTQIESEQLELDQSDFSLSKTIESAVQANSKSAGEKGLHIVTKQDDALPDHLHGDAGRLQQIISGFLHNAISFSENGQITLNTTVEENNDKTAMIRVEVSDEGIGLSPQMQAEIFKGFNQADNSNTRQHGGIGLGLALSRRIAQLMGGTVGVDSEEGAGSSFWLTAHLKLATGPTEQETQDESLSQRETLFLQYAEHHLLLVDDQLMDQEVVSYLAKSVKLKVDVADDYVQAREMLQQAEYALLLVSLDTFFIDNPCEIGEIRNWLDVPNVPMVAMCSGDFTESRNAFEDAGLGDVIEKPLDPDAFYTTLLHWLQHSSRNAGISPNFSPPAPLKQTNMVDSPNDSQ